MTRPLAALVASLCSFGAHAQPPGQAFVVDAGAFCSAAVTSFRADGSAPGGRYQAQDGNGNADIPLQVDASGRGWFVAATLNAGASRAFRIVDARAPERMCIHPTDPYLCFAPSRSGPWAIAKGATHRARYRFVSFDGAPNAAELSRLWRDYAQPLAAPVCERTRTR